MDDQPLKMPPNMTGCSVCVTITTSVGRTEYSASISVQDRTVTGIEDTLRTCGKEVIMQLEHAAKPPPSVSDFLGLGLFTKKDE